MTNQNPTAARLQYLARVLANPPVSRQPCAAGCGQPLTRWHTDAEGRHWHPDCLPAGTAMPVTAEERIRRLEAQLAESRAEVERLQQAHLDQPVLRHCAYPGCLREFDMNGTLTGKHLRPSWSGAGWFQVQAVNGHICPDHAHIVAADAHRPRWNARTGTAPATLGCSCGWTSPPARWRGYGAEAWKDHLLTSAEPAQEAELDCSRAEGFCDVHGFHRHPPLDDSGQHEYLSTGCLHGEHGYCQSNTGAAGTKIPAVCKFCQAPCLCDCHQSAKP